MTGKELLLVLAIAATASGAVGAVVVANGEGAPQNADLQANIDKRFDRIEAALEKTAEAIHRSDRRMTDVSERLASVELEAVEANKAARELAKSGPTRHFGGMTTKPSSSVDQESDVVWDTSGGGLGDLPAEAREQMNQKLRDVVDRLGELSVDGGGLGGMILDADGEGISGALPARLSEAFKGMRAGMKLRALPEEERWQKAQEEVGLTWNQVEELRRATADRDEAMKSAMVVDRDSGTSGDGNSRITIKRMDPVKAAEANASYQRTVDNTLNDDQKKSWREKGYSHAFGRGGSGFGGPTTMSVIAIDSVRDTTNDSQSESTEK